MKGACCVAVAVLACNAPSARAPAHDAAPPPVSASEKTQGVGLCAAYVARVCACAQKQPRFVEECGLAKGRPEALSLHRQLLDGKMGVLNERERRMMQASFRKTVASCVAADAVLDPDKCPRAPSLGAP